MCTRVSLYKCVVYYVYCGEHMMVHIYVLVCIINLKGVYMC